MTKMRIPLRLRWSDVDGYGHVNNAEFFRLLEEARIAAFWSSEDGSTDFPTAILAGGPGHDAQTVVARHAIEYLKPMAYRRDEIAVELWLSKIGGASIDLSYRIVDSAGVVYVQAQSTIVLVDTESGAPRRITPEVRAVLAAYVAEPVKMR